MNIWKRFVNFWMFSGILACAACTVSAPDNALKGDLHLPLTYENWSSNHYKTSGGRNVCAVSSGYNGLTVTVGTTNGVIETVVSSNRRMQPTSSLKVAVGGHHYETYETFFPPKIGNALVDALTHNNKAYLEWSEYSGPASRGLIHVQNVVELTNFNAELKNCHSAVSGR